MTAPAPAPAPAKSGTFVTRLAALTERSLWHAGSAVVYTVVAGVMMYAWLSQPKDAFFLIMGAMFAGSALQALVKLAFPGGNQLAATLLPLVMIQMACTYLFGRDGHWGYGAITVLGLVLFAGAAVMGAAWGQPDKAKTLNDGSVRT